MVYDSKGLQKKLVVNTQKQTREKKRKKKRKIKKKEREEKKRMKLSSLSFLLIKTNCNKIRNVSATLS